MRQGMSKGGTAEIGATGPGAWAFARQDLYCPSLILEGPDLTQWGRAEPRQDESSNGRHRAHVPCQSPTPTGMSTLRRDTLALELPACRAPSLSRGGAYVSARGGIDPITIA